MEGSCNEKPFLNMLHHPVTAISIITISRSAGILYFIALKVKLSLSLTTLDTLLI